MCPAASGAAALRQRTCGLFDSVRLCATRTHGSGVQLLEAGHALTVPKALHPQALLGHPFLFHIHQPGCAYASVSVAAATAAHPRPGAAWPIQPARPAALPWLLSRLRATRRALHSHAAIHDGILRWQTAARISPDARVDESELHCLRGGAIHAEDGDTALPLLEHLALALRKGLATALHEARESKTA